jgi:hypothetical protein
MPETIEAQAPTAAPVAQTPIAAPAPSAAPTPTAGTPTTPAPLAPAAAPIEAPPSKWSDTWREDMAGTLADTATPEEKVEHDKLVKRLSRLNSPADVARAVREADKLISSGTLKKALGKTPTEAEIAAYRKDHGIPEAPEKYDLGVPINTVLSDLDAEMLADWAKKAHGANAAPEVVRAGTAAYLEMRDRVGQQIEERNALAKSETTEELRAEWGADYKANVDGVSSLLKNSPSAAVNDLLSAVTADGVQLLNNPDVVRWLAGHARELGYVGATVVPTGGDIGKSIDSELDDLRKQMGTPEWEKNTKGQARFMQLFEAQKRMNARK